MNWEVILYEASILAESGAKVALLLIGGLLLLQLARTERLKHVSAATQELIGAACETVDELQQTLVDDLKAAHEDGKLDEAEKAMLKAKLLEITLKKMSEPAKKLLIAAGKDISALIQGAAEAWIEAKKAK